MSNRLVSGARKLGIELDQNMQRRFKIYMETLLDWNRRMNLTAITLPEEIVIKHFLDSLVLFKYLQFEADTSLIDVGTGAGFPGLPIKISYPKLNLSLLDSLNKRLNFLKVLLQKLDLKATLLHMRAEEGSRKTELREKFDIAVSRAVATLPVLTEYCLPYVKLGGVFVAMKGSDSYAEIIASDQVIRALGGTIRDVEKLTLPDGSLRTIILIDKIKGTPKDYPRRQSVIKRG